MKEKISEQHIRDEKIRKLKEKILSEIDKQSLNNKKELKIYLERDLKIDSEDYERVIEEEYNMFLLKHFISQSSFNRYSLKESKLDLIVYYISTETIDIWLQEKYNFVSRFLTIILYEEHPVFYILDESFLGSQFTNIYDIVAYKNKMK